MEIIEIRQPEKHIIINGKSYEMGKSEQEDADLVYLSSLAKSEATHWQWIKQGLNVGIIGLLTFMNLSMGSRKTPSIIGIKLCSFWYWFIQVIFVGICIL